MNILIVDDSAIDISIINNAISNVDGIKTFFATTADLAIKIAIRQRPDLIILDIVMPTMDGLELKSRLSRHPITANIPVVFITSSHNSEKDCYRLGCIEFITKPIDLARLIDIIKKQTFLSKIDELSRSYRQCIETLS